MLSHSISEFVRGDGSFRVARLCIYQSVDVAGTGAALAPTVKGKGREGKDSNENQKTRRFEMNTSKPSIVFCHGIWADGSSFSKVIPPLQAEGCEVMAAQYGLDTREGDVATVKRTLGQVSSPVILVGHWDPTVTNRLAKDHEVILFDNAGVEASGGETPYTVVEMTQLCVAFCRALGFNAIHI